MANHRRAIRSKAVRQTEALKATIHDDGSRL